jgi:hypothetical protein
MECITKEQLRRLKLANSLLEELNNFYDGDLDKHFSLDFLYKILNKWSGQEERKMRDCEIVSMCDGIDMECKEMPGCPYIADKRKGTL